MSKPNFSSVTEVSGYKVTKEQIQRMYNRYHFALDFCKDKDVLEIACGSGQGLGYLAGKAKSVVGLDIDEHLVGLAAKYYHGRDKIYLKVADAMHLPFKDNSFDVLILYEAIYYLRQPDKFIAEANRILRHEGLIFICTVNKDWVDFNPSPYSYRYFSVPELYSLLKTENFSDIKIFGDCPVNTKSAKDTLTSFIKRLAVKYHLIPSTMKSKELLKRIFVGKLEILPNEVSDGMSSYSAPSAIKHHNVNSDYKVLYALGRKL